MTGVCRWCVVLAAGCLAGLAGGCSRSLATGRMQLILISPEQEIALGEKAARQAESRYGGAVDDAVLQAYLREVGARVAAGAEREMPYEFTLVGSEVPNAFALPGGKIFVTSGLFKQFTRERQLAAVLGHEIGHVTDRHNIMSMQRQMGASLLADLAERVVGAEGAEAARIGAKVVASAATLSYSRQDEYTADELGVRYLARAGYEPAGMVEMLTTMLDAAEAKKAAWTEMFRTHPLTRHRIERVRRVIRREYPGASFDPPERRRGRFEAMRRRLRRLSKAGGPAEKTRREAPPG